MATAAAHAHQANHNQSFLNSIDPKLFPDWVVTAAFYKALHVVEGLLVRKMGGTANATTSSRQNTPASGKSTDPSTICPEPLAIGVCRFFRLT